MVVVEAAVEGLGAAGAGEQLVECLRFRRGSAVASRVVVGADGRAWEVAMVVWRIARDGNQLCTYRPGIGDLLGAGETTGEAVLAAGATGLLIMMLALARLTCWSCEMSTGPLKTRLTPWRLMSASWERSAGPEKTMVLS